MKYIEYTVVSTRENSRKKSLVVRYDKGRNSYKREFEVPKKASDGELEAVILANAPEEAKSLSRNVTEKPEGEEPESDTIDFPVI